MFSRTANRREVTQGLADLARRVLGKTHDLLVLLAQAVTLEPSFVAERTLCEELTGFAVEVRYPSSMSEPSLEEAKRFVSEARDLLNRVKRVLTPTAEQ